MTVTVRVGDTYMESKERRTTSVTVEDTEFRIAENLWEADDKFDTEHKWSVTARLNVSQECSTRVEVMASALDNVRLVKALGVLGYELHDMLEPGVSVWDRPAADREEDS